MVAHLHTPRPWPARVLRVLRHRLGWDEADARRLLPEAALDRLQQVVATSESAHSGEIRLCIEASLPMSYLWRDATPRDRAVAMFGKLKVWDTEANNGVLIYLLLAEHAIELVVDRGLASHVDPGQWQGIVTEMGAAFRAGRHEEGLLHAVAHVDAVLRRHYPLAPGAANPNELSDRPHAL